MSDSELSRYLANLLITLSKDCLAMEAEVRDLRRYADSEASPGKKSGLYCQSKTIQRNVNVLRKRILKNRFALQTLFGATKIEEIAKLKLR